MTASSRGKRNRQRGQEGEREVCALLHEHTGVSVRRNLGQERDSGTDIHIGPFRIEVKRRKAVAGLYDWIAQAAGFPGVALDDPDYLTRVVALRGDGKDWLVVMRFADWVKLVREEIAGQ